MTYISSTRARCEHSLSDILSPDDNVFISAKGTFIARGYLCQLAALDVPKFLNALSDEHGHDQAPFVVFSEVFDPRFDDNSGDSVTIPREMIHISPTGWVTHYVLDDARVPEQPELKIFPAPQSPHHIELVSPETKEQFSEKVTSILKHIETGEIDKAVLARQLYVSADIEIDARLVLSELISTQPESYIYSVNGYVGASPELLIEKFSRSIRSLPMAGTRKRHARVDDDDASIADLQTHDKDRNEHRVVVDDIVRKLSQCVNEVNASDTPHVVRLPHVAHLATEITASAPGSVTVLDLVKVLHPTPAIAGTPTQQALDIIADTEDFSRGIYSAPVGWMDAHGDGQCAIALRCARLEGTRAQLFAGVGIVDGSVPSQEWDETQAKFGVMRDALVNITQ
jgi:menaquinone-specific isochorismate synthase